MKKWLRRLKKKEAMQKAMRKAAATRNMLAVMPTDVLVTVLQNLSFTDLARLFAGCGTVLEQRVPDIRDGGFIWQANEPLSKDRLGWFRARGLRVRLHLCRKFDGRTKMWLVNDYLRLAVNRNGEFWFDERRLAHRVGGPAVRDSVGYEKWARHGVTHRLDGPAHGPRWFHRGRFMPGGAAEVAAAEAAAAPDPTFADTDDDDAVVAAPIMSPNDEEWPNAAAAAEKFRWALHGAGDGNVHRNVRSIAFYIPNGYSNGCSCGGHQFAIRFPELVTVATAVAATERFLNEPITYADYTALRCDIFDNRYCDNAEYESAVAVYDYTLKASNLLGVLSGGLGIHGQFNIYISSY